MMNKFFALTSAMLFSASVLAAGADAVSIQDPYVRLAPPGAPATAAFMVLKNGGDKNLKVVKVDSPAAKMVEMHNHVNDGGVMKMRPVPAIDIKAKGEAVLKPGGLHIMLIDPKTPLKEGDSVSITLNFDDGSSKTVEARVAKSTGMPMPMEHRH